MHRLQPHDQKLEVLKYTGLIGMAGCFVMFAATVAAPLLHPEMNATAQTISNFAAGRLQWVQDTGIYALAAALVVVAIGLFRQPLDGGRWKIGCGLMAAMGVAVWLIGFRSEYEERPEGMVLHYRIVWSIALLFAAVALLLAKGLRQINPRLRPFSLVIAVFWILTVPFLRVVPSGWNGLYERGVVLLLLVWLWGTSASMLRAGLGPVDLGD